MTEQILFTFQSAVPSCRRCLDALLSFGNPRANGAKRRSGRKPGARVTNLALAIGEVESQHLPLSYNITGFASGNIDSLGSTKPGRSKTHT